MKINEIVVENTATSEALSSVKAGLKTASTGMKAVKNRLAPWLNRALWGGIIVTPIWDYWRAVSKAEEKLKSGQYTPENFNYVRQQEASKLVVTLAVGLSGKTAMALFNGALNITRALPFVGKALGPVLSVLHGMDKTAQAAFVAFLNTETGRRWLAILASFSIFEGTAFEISMPDIAGNLGVWLLDTLNGAIGIKPVTPAATTKPAATPASGTGQSASPSTAEPQGFTPSVKRDFYTGKQI